MTSRPVAGGLGMRVGEASGREVFASTQHFLLVGFDTAANSQCLVVGRLMDQPGHRQETCVPMQTWGAGLRTHSHVNRPQRLRPLQEQGVQTQDSGGRSMWRGKLVDRATIEATH